MARVFGVMVAEARGGPDGREVGAFTEKVDIGARSVPAFGSVEGDSHKHWAYGVDGSAATCSDFHVPLIESWLGMVSCSVKSDPYPDDSVRTECCDKRCNCLSNTHETYAGSRWYKFGSKEVDGLDGRHNHEESVKESTLRSSDYYPIYAESSLSVEYFPDGSRGH